MFLKIDVNNTVTFYLVSLRYREIITLKTATVYNELYFFLSKS